MKIYRKNEGNNGEQKRRKRECQRKLETGETKESETLGVRGDDESRERALEKGRNEAKNNLSVRICI